MKLQSNKRNHSIYLPVHHEPPKQVSYSMSFTGLTCFQAVCLRIYIRFDPQGAGFIQKIATIFQGLFKDFSRTTLDFQGQPTRNIISQIVQKCIFPVYYNKTLRL